MMKEKTRVFSVLIQQKNPQYLKNATAVSVKYDCIIRSQIDLGKKEITLKRSNGIEGM